MSNFWESFIKNSALNPPSVMDEFLSRGEKRANASVQELTDKYKNSQSLELPVLPGTKVAFVASIESMMGVRHPPADGATGTTVMIRSASYGDITSLQDFVFVKWDHGGFSQMDRRYLRKVTGTKTASEDYVKFAYPGSDFSQFLKVSADSDDLVHKATQDLWSCKKGQNGEVILSRLFDETGEPLKV